MNSPDRRSESQLQQDAMAIWRAGVAAVDSTELVKENVHVDSHTLDVGGQLFDLDKIDRIEVVGAGKAGAGMAAGLEAALGENILAKKRVSGWLNVPADCVRPLQTIQLHAARPPGVNEPTEQGVCGTAEILRRVEALHPSDLCICLLSGGGSALLPAPDGHITLADKQDVTRFLSGAGANIEQLNTVRKQLSRIKGGGLARACNAGHLVCLIISDVIGDPLDTIASGPTVADSTTARNALEILELVDATEATVAPAIFEHLRCAAQDARRKSLLGEHITNVIIGNNAVAVDAAGMEAERRGYCHAMTAASTLEGSAEEIGQHLARMAQSMRGQPGPDCLITGGEPTVKLVPAARRGRGGRNQQLVLAAIEQLAQTSSNSCDGITLLSGGTDGEDGPTDAAGAILTPQLFRDANDSDLSPRDFLDRNDAYHFFDKFAGLIRTGPTHTNVCDLRVVVVDRVEQKSRPRA